MRPALEDIDKRTERATLPRGSTVSLILLFVLLTLVLLALLWGGALIAQSYLYNAPVEKLPLRAVVCSVIMSAFITFWCRLDVKTPGRYDTLLDFSNEDVKEYDSFEAIKMAAKIEEKTKTVTFGKESNVLFRRQSGGKSTADYLDENRKPFVRGNSEFLVVAVVVKDKDGATRRFEAERDENGRFRTPLEYREQGTRAYMTEEGLGRVFTPKTSTLALNLALNFFHFALWFAIFWYGLRFSPGHASLLTLGFFLVTMLAVIPVLFQQNRDKPPPPAVVAPKL